MHVWVMDRLEQDWEATQLIAGLRAAGLGASFVDWNTIGIGTDGVRIGGRVIDPPEVAFVRSPVTTRAQPSELIVELERLHLLERAGVRLINTADAIEQVCSKLRQATMLADRSLPIPTTCVVRSVAEIEHLVAEWGQAVVKPIYGHAGVGVFSLGRSRPGTMSEREGIHLWHLLRQQAQLLVQQRIGERSSYVRVCIIGTKVVCQFRLTIEGGSGIPHELGTMSRDAIGEDEPFAGLALSAAQALGVEIAAVDLMDDGESAVVIEVNPDFSRWQKLEGTSFDLTERGITQEHVAMVVGLQGRGAEGL